MSHLDSSNCYENDDWCALLTMLSWSSGWGLSQSKSHIMILCHRLQGKSIVHNGDLIKGTGRTVLCGQLTNPVVHYLTNDYWGTSSAADSDQWITDKNDDPAILAEVLYDPFSGSVLPAENKFWGSVKALFR